MIHVQSHEEHKTIYCGLGIFGIALSDQSDLPAFFSPRKVILKFLSIPAQNKPESLAPGKWLKAACFIKSSFEIPACRKPKFRQSR